MRGRRDTEIPANTKLRTARERTPSRLVPGGLTRAELAALIDDYVYRHHGISTPVDRKYIAKLEAGRIRWPNRRYREALRVILGAHNDYELGFLPANMVHGGVALDSPQDVELRLPWTVNGALDAVTAVEADMDRRTLLIFGPAVFAQLALDWHLAPAIRAVERTSGHGPVTGAQVDALDRFVGELRLMDDRHGGAAVVVLAKSQAQAVAQLLRHHTYTETVGRRLYATSAELHRFLGWLHWDGQDPQRALRHWNVALRAAHAAGDRRIAGNVWAYVAGQAAEIGNVDDALRYGTLACQVQSSPRVEAIASYQYAMAAGAAGHNDDCRTALDTAANALATMAPSHGEPDWSYWMDDYHSHEMTGRGLLLVGEPEPAAQHLELFIAGVGPGREQVRGYSFLAEARIAQGETDEAARVAELALDQLQTGIQSPRCIQHMGRLHDTLVGYDTDATRAFGDRYRQICA